MSHQAEKEQQPEALQQQDNTPAPAKNIFKETVVSGKRAKKPVARYGDESPFQPTRSSKKTPGGKKNVPASRTSTKKVRILSESQTPRPTQFLEVEETPTTNSEQQSSTKNHQKQPKSTSKTPRSARTAISARSATSAESVETAKSAPSAESVGTAQSVQSARSGRSAQSAISGGPEASAQSAISGGPEASAQSEQSVNQSLVPSQRQHASAVVPVRGLTAEWQTLTEQDKDKLTADAMHRAACPGRGNDGSVYSFLSYGTGLLEWNGYVRRDLAIDPSNPVIYGQQIKSITSITGETRNARGWYFHCYFQEYQGKDPLLVEHFDLNKFSGGFKAFYNYVYGMSALRRRKYLTNDKITDFVHYGLISGVDEWQADPANANRQPLLPPTTKSRDDQLAELSHLPRPSIPNKMLVKFKKSMAPDDVE